MEARRQVILWALAIAMVIVPILACRPGGPSPEATPWKPIRISPEDAEQLESKIREQILENPQSRFRLEITQEEITSYMALNVQDYPIVRPEIRFAPRLVYISAILIGIGPLQAKVFAASSAEVSEGRVTLDIKEATVGGISIPQSVLRFLSTMMTQTLDEAQSHATIEEIELLEGKIILAGEKGS